MSSAVLDDLRPLIGDGEAHFVGGCVRDVRLGRPVVDVDVVVPGDPAPAGRRGRVAGWRAPPAARRSPSRRPTARGAWCWTAAQST